ncbi:hypothetical protein ACFSSA_08575 [Luteolibacter algae]|uniref:STAS/SEC14 domain-containing protein n=1 Tax=Luteolibacter algae TaxID=454151 RepID=A0ABW5D8J6_9BACT
MDSNLSYNISDSLVYVTLKGDFTVQESMALLDEVLHHQDVIIPANLLIDVREATAQRTTEQIEEVASHINEWREKISRIAVLTGSDLHFGITRMGVSYVDPAAVKVSPFRNIEDAIVFLTSQDV